MSGSHQCYDASTSSHALALTRVKQCHELCKANDPPGTHNDDFCCVRSHHFKSGTVSKKNLLYSSLPLAMHTSMDPAPLFELAGAPYVSWEHKEHLILLMALLSSLSHVWCFSRLRSFFSSSLESSLLIFYSLHPPSIIYTSILICCPSELSFSVQVIPDLVTKTLPALCSFSSYRICHSTSYTVHAPCVFYIL